MLHDLVARYGTALIFANALAASLGLPVPALPTLVVFGAFAALHPLSVGSQLATVLIVAVCATLIGDSVWFYAGRLYGGATLQKLCKLSLSRDTCVKKTERFFGRWGVRVLIVAKLVPGLSIVSVPMAGAMGTRYRTFLAHDGVGAALWAGLGLAVGVVLAPQIDVVLQGANSLGHFTAVVVGALALIYAGWRWMRRRALLRQLAAARLEVDELYKLMAGDEPPVVFDIRSDETRQLDPYVIPGARFADERNLDSILTAYRRNQKLVIYCSCPNEVSAAWMAKQLTDSGFTDAVPLRGGIDAWRSAGYTITPLPVEAAAATTDAPVSAEPKSDPKIV
jgi:membrane protein DedA with SNARE-associated domain/rhodanese-related sulfurtransferase